MEPTEPPPTPASAPVEPSPVDEGPLPTLRTGPTVVAERAPVELVVVARGESRGATFLELEIPQNDGAVHFDPSTFEVEGGLVVLDEFQAKLLVRFPGTLPARVEGVAHGVLTATPHQDLARVPLRAEVGKAKVDRSLPERWAVAMVEDLSHGSASWWLPFEHPWFAFASARLRGVAGGQSRGRMPERPPSDLARLMETTTASTALQEALQHDRGLGLPTRTGRPSVPIGKLQPPKLDEHPFAQMRAELPKRAGDPATEPLAASVPADFWYLRFDDIRDMLRLLDEAEAWLTPVAHVLDGRAEARSLSSRYQRQLGLQRSGLAKQLGHTVVSRLAVVGSDPYLRDGSDVTFVFEVANHSVFDVELARHMAAYEDAVPGISETTRDYQGHTISHHGDPLGRVRQHRARIGDVQLVSNSAGAIERIIDAIDGRGPRLAGEADLQYMLARDPVHADVFAFVGDRFVASVVGPTQKIAQARRELALSELLVPGYAALLYGWLQGEPPADLDTLLRSKLLTKEELVHDDGSKIAFEPGAAAHSRYGSPDGLTALIDLPTPTKVTKDEQAAYERFAAGYQDYWRTFIDPIAVRMDLDEHGRVTLDARVLPFIEGSAYRSTEDIVGHARVETPAIEDGVQAVWGVGDEARIRRDLDQLADQMFSRSDLRIGWLGNWVMLGALDRRGLTEMHQWVEDEIQHRPTTSSVSQQDELWRRLGRLPVYAAAEVRNPAALVAMLGAMHTLVDEVSPGDIEWGEHAKHRGRSIVRVGVSSSSNDPSLAELADAVALYYARSGGALIVALDEAVLRALIDRFEDGEVPRATDDPAAGMQATVHARMTSEGPLWTSALWVLQRGALAPAEQARRHAEVLLRGQPGLDEAGLRALGLQYLGSYPLTPSGRSDFRIEHGLVADPIHGSTLAPTHPALPVPGSPIETLMKRLVSVRGDVAFDAEPMDARSLHTRFELELSAPE